MDKVYNDGVFLKTTIVQKQVYRFKVVNSTGCMYFGIAPYTPLFKENLYEKYHPYCTFCGNVLEKEVWIQGKATHTGEEFTMSIDLNNKTMTVSQGGQNLVKPFSIAEYGDMQMLRPIVRLVTQGDSLEIL